MRYPAIEPDECGMLDVGDGQSLFGRSAATLRASRRWCSMAGRGRAARRTCAAFSTHTARADIQEAARPSIGGLTGRGGNGLF
jgi:hypothetical protein